MKSLNKFNIGDIVQVTPRPGCDPYYEKMRGAHVTIDSVFVFDPTIGCPLYGSVGFVFFEDELSKPKEKKEISYDV